MVLADPLATATKEARSPFLKSEAFRLVAALISKSKSDSQNEELGNRGRKQLQAALPALALGIIDALQDDDMKKTKRDRDVLKAADQLLSFLGTFEGSDSTLATRLQEMKAGLVTFKDTSESAGVTNTCEKLIGQLEKIHPSDTNVSEEVESSSSNTKKKKKKRGKKK